MDRPLLGTYFAPDLVGNVLPDFENGRKKGEFGRWILYELSRSRYCSQDAQQRGKAAGAWVSAH